MSETSQDRRAIIKFAAFAMLVCVPLAVLVFLSFSSFFSSWDARALSVRHTADAGADTRTYDVFVVDDQRSGFDITVPAHIARRLELPVRPNPRVRTPPEDAPRLEKSAFSLTYYVHLPDGPVLPVGSTSPGALGAGLLMALLVLLLRNMVVAKHPLRVTPAPAELPGALAPMGQVAGKRPDGARPRGKKGPPPPRRRKGRGRR